VAEEMGVTLGRAAYSPNIKERLDFSCALFLGDGRMLAQAAHIPVHLGAMPASVQAAIAQCAPFAPGDVVIVNDPYQGGNHLPDITLVSPVFFGNQLSVIRVISGQSVTPSPCHPSPCHPVTPSPPPPYFFVASRAHHADVGGMSPGSMPLSTEIYQEGIIIPPIKLVGLAAQRGGVAAHPAQRAHARGSATAIWRPNWPPTPPARSGWKKLWPATAWPRPWPRPTR
jgi:N-methylhydantoinase B